MITTDRNPDHIAGVDTLPDDCYIHEGLLLQQRAKTAGVPFGVAKARKPLPGNSKAWRLATVGLVIRLTDKKRMTAAAERKARTTGKGKSA